MSLSTVIDQLFCGLVFGHNVLGKIHLRERLAYRNTGLKKKKIEVHGSFSEGMKIDATYVANTSWLRAILWAFILALRAETIKTLAGNPLPLVLLDDPQLTFDPRNKRRWAQELARVANLPRTDPEGAQIILTTHEHEFFTWMTDLEKINGHYGLIAPVSDSWPAASVISGGCLDRYWLAADRSNNDAAAREYIRHVRIHTENFLKLLMRADVHNVHRLNFEKLRDELQQLRANSVAPYNRQPFGELLKCMQGCRELTFLSDVHHSDAEHLGVAEAQAVHNFWSERLEPKLLRASDRAKFRCLWRRQ